MTVLRSLRHLRPAESTSTGLGGLGQSVAGVPRPVAASHAAKAPFDAEREADVVHGRNDSRSKCDVVNQVDAKDERLAKAVLHADSPRNFHQSTAEYSIELVLKVDRRHTQAGQ